MPSPPENGTTTVLDAVRTVLHQAGQPLHYKEITKRILQQHLWSAHGKTPEATVNAQITRNIGRLGNQADFIRAGKGVYSIRNSGTPPTSNTLSFTDAAETVLSKYADKKPMHYRDVAKRALELGLIKTAGLTPESTMYAQILQEIERRTKRGVAQRFVRHGKGLLSLAKWEHHGLEDQIERHNASTQKQLLGQLQSMPAKLFEDLIARLLAAIGFEEIEVTSYSSDGGIDVRGTLVVGEVIRTRMAVQAKRWKKNVQSPVVQQVRGSLGAHEQGLIIATSDFSSGARKEAERADTVPVALMNGEQLVTLLVEHQIGVKRTPHYLVELGDVSTDIGEGGPHDHEQD